VFKEGGEGAVALPGRLRPVVPSFPRSLEFFLLLHCTLLHCCRYTAEEAELLASECVCVCVVCVCVCVVCVSVSVWCV